MDIRRITLVFALILAGCASSDSTELPPPDTAKSEQTTEQDQATGGTAQEAEETEEAEENDENLPEKETKMADSNAPEDVAAPPEDATTTDSGLAFKILEEGDGDSPTKTSTVRVHYTGWTTDGKKFDSSHDRGKPAEFPLNRVIAGWTEGVSMMKEGEKRRLWIPEELAYQGRPGAPQGMLVFDVELLKIVQK